ncbi:MAG TPA: HD-GYP domain-containing protein [Thermodesulfobacteriota bacterium]|jgi:HD-GYP domain-containing protein (c-di-GMP phosphodiesterase class II)|nr:HD-GYP domain-containing protein [Thermodesulfobacteriota bacterium]
MEGTQSVAQPEKAAQKKSEGMGPELSKLANNLVTKFHVLMRISQIYDSKNVALHQFIQESLQTVNTLIEREGILSLKIVKDDFFFNEQRLRYSVEGFTSFKYLLTQWKKRLIGEVSFKSAVDERILREFIYILIHLEEGQEKNAALFNEQLASRNIASVEVNPLEVAEGEEEGFTLQREDQREVGKKVFFETIGTIKEVITQIKSKQYADVRKLKRFAQKAVHLVIEDESILLGMTTIKDYDEYTFNHSVNVSIYSLAIGKRLGFSKKALTELGITALLHDIGKSKIPREVLNKPASLNEEEWGMMKRHPLMGVEILLNLKQLGEINPRMVIGIFDHHLKSDLSGYPKLFRKKEMSLFGRIIQIADSYDAMTTPRIYKKTPYTPEQALALLLRERTVHYDPILLKIFIGLVGIYPIGSLVLLNTREMGIVYKPDHDPKWLDRPAVILIDRGEKGDVKKEVVDLKETDGLGRYKRSIVKALDPYQYHIDIAKYFL